MNKKKIATTVAALGTAAAVLLGGTFAWQSINQTALNEASDIVNPGGRLHNDMWYETAETTNSDIYVENFAEDPIYARVQLSEYFEITMNYGKGDAERTETLAGAKTLKETPGDTDDTGKNLYDYTYAIHYFGLTDEQKEAGTASTADGEVDNKAYTYWDWAEGKAESNRPHFMPTFNKNKDSLAPDLNGLYRDRVGGISNREAAQYVDTDGNALIDYQGYGADVTETWNAIYDGDANSADELKDLDAVALADIIKNGENTTTSYDADAVKLVSEPHTTKQVGVSNGLISMTEWLAKLDNGEATDNYWVYDTDGWVYWSSAIPAGEATGLLLDSFTLNQVMDDTWYYAILVTGQFVTGNDMGSAEDQSGFYTPDENGNVSAPSEDALKLLEEIGVDVDGSGSTGGETTGGDSNSGDISAVNLNDESRLINGNLYLAPGENAAFSFTSETLTASDVTWNVAKGGGETADTLIIDSNEASSNQGAVLFHNCSDADNCTCGTEPYYVSVTINETGETVECVTPIYPYAYVENETPKTATWTLTNSDGTTVRETTELSGDKINIQLTTDEYPGTYNLILSNFTGEIDHWDNNALFSSWNAKNGTLTFSPDETGVNRYLYAYDSVGAKVLSVELIYGLDLSFQGSGEEGVNYVGENIYYVKTGGNTFYRIFGDAHSNEDVTYSLINKDTNAKLATSNDGDSGSAVTIVEDATDDMVVKIYHNCASADVCSCDSDFYYLQAVTDDGLVTETSRNYFTFDPDGIYVEAYSGEPSDYESSANRYPCALNLGRGFSSHVLGENVAVIARKYDGSDAGLELTCQLRVDNTDVEDLAAAGYSFEKSGDEGYYFLTMPETLTAGQRITLTIGDSTDVVYLVLDWTLDNE